MAAEPDWSRRRLAVGLPLMLAFGCAGKAAATLPPPQTIDSALSRVRRKLRRHVDDRQRRELALAKIDELSEVLSELNRLAYRWRTDTHDALGRGEGREQLIAIADQINAQIHDELRRAAAIGVGLREDVRADEWSRVFPATKAARS